ncbi:MAG: hypothetical protein QF659_03035 [Dehalococcoidia bacterium]|nr:hypothetical protein [Dehalococcoidia bacterium]
MTLNGVLSVISGHPEYLRHLAAASTPAAPPRVAVRQGARPGYIGALWRHQGAPLLVITPRSMPGGSTTSS